MKKLLLFIVGLFGIFSFCSADGIYHSSSLGLISVVDNGNVYTLHDKNLGASYVYDFDITHNQSTEYIGEFYQWGNNHGFKLGYAFNYSYSTVDTSNYGPNNYYNSNNWIVSSSDWSDPKNNDLWGGVTNTDIARKGPCPDGYHIAKSSDWVGIYNYGNSRGFWSYTNGASLFSQYFYIPLVGYFNYNGSFNNSAISYIWSSDPYGSTADVLNLELLFFSQYDRVDPIDQEGRSYGFNIRCFKNDPVEPDSTWSVITGDIINDGPVINDPILRVNYGNISYDYILTDILEIRLNSPVLKDGDNYSYNGSTGINLFYNGQSQFYNKSELYLFTPSWYSDNNIFTPICL